MGLSSTKKPFIGARSSVGSNLAPKQFIQWIEDFERSARTVENTGPNLFSDDGMARIWIELLTKATLYAGAIGLIAGMAALFFTP